MARVGSKINSAPFFLRKDHWQEIAAHLQTWLPEEACGLVGGRHKRSEVVIPVENELHSPVRFRMTPEEQWRAFRALDDLGLDLLAVFHSHPAGPQEPSETDRREFFYPGVYSLICTPQGGGWKIRAFLILDNQVEEVKLEIE